MSTGICPNCHHGWDAHGITDACAADDCACRETAGALVPLSDRPCSCVGARRPPRPPTGVGAVIPPHLDGFKCLVCETRTKSEGQLCPACVDKGHRVDRIPAAGQPRPVCGVEAVSDTLGGASAGRCWCGSEVGFRSDKGFIDCLADRTHDWRGKELRALAERRRKR